MSTRVLTLADFVLARIADDAEGAAAAVGRGLMWGGLADGVAAHDVQAGWHVLRWNPVRVLAECDAKREIARRGDPGSLRALAGIYADHPDYREEWRRP